jgi:multiple sugar transport system permease protein
LNKGELYSTRGRSPIHSANRVAPNRGADLSDRHLPFLHLADVLDARHSTEVGQGIGQISADTLAARNGLAKFYSRNRNVPVSPLPGKHIFYAALTMLGSVLSNFVIAYGFSRIKWPGRDLLFYPVIASIFIFIQFPVNPITMVPMFSFFARLGLVNSYLPLILPTFFGNPFFIFLLRQFMLQIPSKLSEAARIDGANELQIMYRIILPLTRPALVVVALLAGVNAWNDFLGPLIYLQNDKLYTLSLGLTFFKTMHGIQFNLLMAASCLVVLPVVAVFLFFQRFFIEGISLGGK